MKTNQIMKRPLGNFMVEQRTKDSMFNATSLLKQWNNASGECKEVTKFFENENTKEFVSALMEEENLNTQNSAYLKVRGKHGGTWMHPILFVKFAMWLNPRFEVQVIKFVYDQMLKYRNEAGEAYKALSTAVGKIVPENEMRKKMPIIGKALNWIVFNKHEHQARNEYGVEDKQRELFNFERQVAMLINDGFIRNYDS